MINHQSPSPSVDECRETGWLIERKNLGPRLFWYIEDSTGWHDWTPVAADAKRFATRDEAEAFPAYRLIAKDPAISLTEHVFVNASLVSPPKAAGERVTEIMVEPFTDTVVLLLTGEGETMSAILDTSYAVELRDKLNAALANHEARGELMRREFNDAIDFTLDVASGEGLEFLRAWREGNVIDDDWPEWPLFLEKRNASR